MKNIKKTKPFYFKNKSNKDIADILDKEFPIKLNNNEDLINRVCLRYPHIPKSQVAVIVKVIFESIRTLLIFGDILMFNNFLFDMKLFFFKYVLAGYKYPVLKVKITTPPPLRKE